MSRRYLTLSALLIGLLSIVVYVGARAQDETTTVVEKHVVITPSPKSTKCTTVTAHWEGDVWVDDQTVCTYENRPEGAAWIQDYWACTAYTATGDCSAWEFKPGHWVKTYP